MAIDYEATIDSMGNQLCLYDKYLVANDGTFVLPDSEEIYDFLVREYWPDEIATQDGLNAAIDKEFKIGAYADYDEETNEWNWLECSVNEVLHEYGLIKGAVKNA